MIITYKDDKKEINEPIKVKDLFAEEIKNSKYNKRNRKRRNGRDTSICICCRRKNSFRIEHK